MTLSGSADVYALLRQADRALKERPLGAQPLHVVASMVCFGEGDPSNYWTKKNLLDLPLVQPTRAQLRVIAAAIDLARKCALTIRDEHLRIRTVSGRDFDHFCEGQATLNYTDGSVTISLDLDEPLSMILVCALHELQHASDFWERTQADAFELERRARRFVGQAVGERLVAELLAGEEK